MEVEGAEKEEVEVEGVYFEVKGWRSRRCSLRSKGRRWRLRGAVCGLGVEVQVEGV